MPRESYTVCWFDFASESVWFTINNNGTVVRIDLETNKVVAQIKVGPGNWYMDATDEGVWVKPQPGRLLRIDPETNKVARRHGLHSHARGRERIRPQGRRQG